MLVELGARERRVRQHRDAGAGRSAALERRSNQRRFAGAGIANHQRDAGSSGQAVVEVRQRFLMLLRQKEKARVRQQLERPLTQPVEILVHVYFQTFQTTAAVPAAATSSTAAEIATIFQRPSPCTLTSGSTGIPASTTRFSDALTSISERSVLSRYSISPANTRPRLKAAAIPMRCNCARLGLVGRSGRRAGSRILNCSPICRRSRLAATFESSFFVSMLV